MKPTHKDSYRGERESEVSPCQDESAIVTWNLWWDIGQDWTDKTFQRVSLLEKLQDGTRMELLPDQTNLLKRPRHLKNDVSCKGLDIGTTQDGRKVVSVWVWHWFNKNGWEKSILEPLWATFIDGSVRTTHRMRQRRRTCSNSPSSIYRPRIPVPA